MSYQPGKINDSGCGQPLASKGERHGQLGEYTSNLAFFI
jgi:hypothetical protein